MLPSVTNASYTYSRTPAGASLNAGSNLLIHLAGNSADLNGGDASCVNLELRIGTSFGFDYETANYPIIDGFNQDINWFLSSGIYTGIRIHRFKADNYTDCGTDTYLEGNGTTTIFSVAYASPTPTPASSLLFTVTNDTEGYRDMIAGDLYAEHFKPTIDQVACTIRQKVEIVSHSSVSYEASLDWSVKQGTNINTATTITGFATELLASISWVSSNPIYHNFLMSNCATLTANLDYWFLFRSTHLLTADVVRIYKRNSIQSSQSGAWLRASGTGSYTAQQADWSFQLRSDSTISAGYSGGWGEPATASYGFENKDFGILGNYFRDVIVYLFFPDEATLSQFGNLFETIKNKPPIGYFTQIKNLFSNLSTGTADLSFTLTPFALILSPLRTGLEVILWFMLAFWLLHRFRQFIL